MAVKFHSPTLHGTIRFVPGVPLAFEDPDAEDYFEAAKFADYTDEEPVMTYGLGEVDIDPETVFGSGANVGDLVLPPIVEG